jgi:hypothetical protein
MLKSFLEGYNVTIMAYGQTGSGKTFTMGTADLQEQDSDNQGLIPRFVTDLFRNLKNSSFRVKISFLEIYGEDVYDLISPGASNQQRDRQSLMVREDEAGKVFVQVKNNLSFKYFHLFIHPHILNCFKFILTFFISLRYWTVLLFSSLFFSVISVFCFFKIFISLFPLSN